MRRFPSRLTYANVTATLALVIAVAGGTAYAANTIGSADVINNSLLSADLANNKAVKSGDVQSESLTGADIADQSGVDTCPDGSQRLGQLCVRVTNLSIDWEAANYYCRDVDLRLPTPAEGLWLEANHDLGIGNARFWTEEFQDNNTVLFIAKDGQTAPKGFIGSALSSSTSVQVVCVTTPTN